MSNEKLEALKLGLLVPWDRQAIDTNRRIDAAHALGIAEGKREAADALAAHNAMLRPADIVAARIEGLREAMAIKEKAASSMLSYPGIGKETGEIRIVDGVKEANLINARIAELEAAAPEVSETRAKAEAFDAALTRFVANPGDVADWTAAQLRGFLHEAKRKGVGT